MTGAWRVRRSRMVRHGRVFVLAATIGAVVSGASGVLVAQSSGADASGSPWDWRWSPLRSFGDLGLPRPGSPESPRLLELPAPRVGLAWSSGNPAGLRDDIDSAWTHFVVASGRVSGSYRRPLDPASAATTGTSLSAWRRVGARLAAVGRVSVERETIGDGTAAAFVNPYGSAPFVPTDTNRPVLRRPIVTIEGGEAIALGRWRIGVAAGFRLLENNSSRSAASLLGRASSAGLTLGVSRRVGDQAQVGVHGRRLAGSESVNLVANPRTVRVYALDGLVSVDPGDFSIGLPPFFRRADRSSNALGADASGSTLGAAWSTYARWQTFDERQLFALSTNAPVDRWRTTGYAVGGAAQRVVWKMLATLRADWSSQRGHAQRVTTAGGSYAADASALALAADFRYGNAATLAKATTPANASPWTWGVTLAVGRDAQAVNDRAARMTTDIAAWTPSVAAEVGRAVSERMTLVAGYGIAGYTPYAGVPSPADRGRAYRTLIAPAMEVAAAAARTDRATIAARWRLGGRDLSVGGWRERLRPLAKPAFDIPLPRGTRAAWGVVVGVGVGVGR